MRKHEGQVYAVAYARLLNVADAEDVVQETFLQGYRALHQLRKPDRFGGWIARIALSFAVKRLRARTREPVADVAELLRDAASQAMGQEGFERDEDARGLVEGALASLPETLRAPFVMRHVAEASYKSIAESLLIGPRAAERRVRLARARLQRYFAARGTTDLARDALLTGLLIPKPMQSLLDALPDAPPDTPKTQHGGGALAAGFTGALVVSGALVLLGGVKAMRSTGRVEARDVVMIVGPAASWSGAAPTRGVGPMRNQRSPIPAGARLIADMSFEGIAPGQPLPGWTSGAFARTGAARYASGRVVGMVNTNIPEAYYRFPAVQGVVTIDLMLKPAPGEDANCNLKVGSGIRGWQPDGVALHGVQFVGKNSSGVWSHSSPDALAEHAVPFLDHDDRWHHVVLRIDTMANRYDLVFDGRRIAEGLPAPIDLSAGISFIALNSGRWGRERDVESYFDDLLIYVEPGASAGVTRAARTEGGARS
jgi:RNA polymerase sigma-70 factor (ECF subfamily)